MAARRDARLVPLVGLGVACLVCYGVITVLSRRFVPGQGHRERPILSVLALYAMATLFYLAAVWLVRQRSETVGKPIHRIVLPFALGFRLFQLPGNPIQEVDIYRYLWDGRVAAAGVNPFTYSPVDVESASTRIEDYEKLVPLLRQPAVQEIFKTIEHRWVPTVYPPMSQAVFALAALVTPPEWPPLSQAAAMKGVLLLFDCGTILMLARLLRDLGQPPAWCLIYAWCPLVVKEAANSGHVDAVAVFFTILAAWLAVRGRGYLAASALAGAVLSKVYPVILVPLFLVHQGRTRGWRRTVGPLLLGLGIVALAYVAVWPDSRRGLLGGSPLVGLRVFLTEWEVNDLIFHQLLSVVDWLWPPAAQDQFAQGLGRVWPQAVEFAGADPTPVPPGFVASMAIMGIVLAALIGWLALRPRTGTAEGFLNGLFAALTALFLLGPTANPWYLTWAIPFLPWARLASWYLLPLVVFQYYLRFWFIYHYSDFGRDFFNDVYLWVEWLPFYAFLGIEAAWRRLTGKTGLREGPG